MISYIDIAFLILTVILVAVSISRGLVVSILSMVRFIIIVPASYFLGSYVMSYIPRGFFGTLPETVDKVIVCVLCFFALLIVSSLLLTLLKYLQKKKGMPLRHTNAFLGGVLGVVKALVIIIGVCTAFGYVIEYIPNDNTFYQAIDTSYVVSFINDYNPLIK
ncbi:MAG: CvpA family protein [Clostridium sp.]|nr:CvpA family protein [Clostridium sp.]